MKHMKQWAAALLTLTLVLGGCTGASKENPQESVIYRVTGLEPGTVAYTVNGTEYPMEFYLYWLAYNMDYYEQMYSYYGMEVDWTEESDGMTMGEYAKNEVLEASALYFYMDLVAKELGLEIPEDKLTEMNEQLATTKEELGDNFSLFLDSIMLTEEQMIELEHQLYSRTLVYDYYYGENGIEEIDYAAFAEENNYVSAKHILIRTMDDTGATLSEEEQAAAYTRAEELLAMLQEDPSRFDELMNEYSEDTGLMSYPDGYIFTTGEMMEEFETATFGLEVGEISGIVTTDYGYHIILRQEIDQTDAEFRSAAVDAQWNARVDGYLEEMDIETTDAWAGLDVVSIAEKRAEITQIYQDAVTAAAAEAEGAEETEGESAEGNS